MSVWYMPVCAYRHMCVYIGSVCIHTLLHMDSDPLGEGPASALEESVLLLNDVRGPMFTFQSRRDRFTCWLRGVCIEG